MSRCNFFKGLTPLDQFMGNLFFRGQPISEIYKLTFSEAAYWSDWHDRIADAESRAAEGIKSNA